MLKKSRRKGELQTEEIIDRESREGQGKYLDKIQGEIMEF
jgi:hypothetical protein